MYNLRSRAFIYASDEHRKTLKLRSKKAEEIFVVNKKMSSEWLTKLELSVYFEFY